MGILKIIESLFEKKPVDLTPHMETFHRLCYFAEQLAQERGQEVSRVKEFQQIGSRRCWNKHFGNVLTIATEGVTHKLTISMIFTREYCVITIRLKSVKECGHIKNRIKKVLSERKLLKETSTSWNFKTLKRFNKIVRPSDREGVMLTKISKFIKMLNDEHSLNSF